MVYRLSGYDASVNCLRNCFFRQGDWFVGFSETKDLVVANEVGTFFKVGDDTGAIAPFKNNANAGEVNKWCSLSVHWNGNSPQTNKSSVFCNGKKLTNSTDKKMQIGVSNYDLSLVFSSFVMNFSGTGMSKGDMAFFMFKQGLMDERTVLLHRKLFL